MNRILALLCALLLASITISSACVAAEADWIHFTLEPDHGGNRIKASFREQEHIRDYNNWSSGFMASELPGLDLAGFRSSGTRPLRFSLIREAGRLDCAGSGGGSYASGTCSLTPNPAFTQLLVSRGIGRPTREQAFGLVALNVRRELIEAVARAHYPTPTIDDLEGMTAVGVSGDYIAGLAGAGYRPHTIHNLVEFRALGITPEWIGSFARAGYGNLPASELVQLKAMNISPAFIAGYERLGYRNLSASTLVQLKALDITPEFVRAHVDHNRPLPPASELVQLKLFGDRR